MSPWNTCPIAKGNGQQSWKGSCRMKNDSGIVTTTEKMITERWLDPTQRRYVCVCLFMMKCFCFCYHLFLTLRDCCHHSSFHSQPSPSSFLLRLRMTNLLRLFLLSGMHVSSNGWHHLARRFLLLHCCTFCFTFLYPTLPPPLDFFLVDGHRKRSPIPSVAGKESGENSSLPCPLLIAIPRMTCCFCPTKCEM